ncbi:MAG: uncharacterized protein KVP18_003489 [Porospora cf. gigantea A]|uniref:uncharacterized protein n=1 Tax=Porospora cf. gigantea A TaxID=2853593 RepID=UPI0035596141|nr:MAG: hypothetical protein KVP18_003489 [Porospora cf. gigantea A]
MANTKERFVKTIKWFGFVTSGCLLLIQGIVHLTNSHAHLNFNAWWNDPNASSWRYALFTFMPDVFFDKWTPFFMGFAGLTMHLKQIPLLKTQLQRCTQNSICFFAWNLVAALFGSLGFDGGLGIVVGTSILLTCLLCLITVFLERDADMSLKLDLKCQARSG